MLDSYRGVASLDRPINDEDVKVYGVHGVQGDILTAVAFATAEEWDYILKVERFTDHIYVEGSIIENTLFE
ncbi:hypothetical protein ONS95_010247 [Cadophora gregata]|uniref:uncharacterized protein n=1 Tax=Cadophora gregata TaxID=51156 RepID=UPI0026DCA30A|nr:uncharacterized protein ONS95_010247 [Cadophora gregata]KAK0121977.1 hypothetical protein ONS95_010247 [Cadophora gregata]KAK0127458.1 hypothetical protein ONS96_006995 [Cadophora gregata f. sp. sojae]